MKRMAAGVPIGQYLDDPDALFGWLNGAVFGVAVMNAANRSGVTARVLEGPATTADLAAAADLPVESLERLLAYLLAHEVIGRDGEGRWLATARTRAMHDAAGYFTNAQTGTMAASKLVPALRAGHTPFVEHFGQPAFAWLRDNPDLAALFGSFMGWMTRRFTRFLFAHHRFHPFASVADIGGSMGDLLLAVLAEYPQARGLLFDLPETVAMARPRVAASPLGARVELVEGSFFDTVPVADLYLLKQILHDWDDAECTAILATIRRAIPPQGRLVVIDHILADQPTPDEAQGTDIAMLVWATGRERRLAEFEALFAAAGFRLDRVSRNPSGHSVMELVPA